MRVGRVIILTLLIFGLIFPTCNAQIYVKQPDGTYILLNFSHINTTAPIYWKNGTSYEKLGLEDIEVEDYHIYVGGYKLNFTQIGTIDELTTELCSRNTEESVWFAEKQPLDRVVTVFNNTSYDAAKVASIFNELSPAKAADIINSSDFSLAKAVDVLSAAELSADAAQAILYEQAKHRLPRSLDIVTYGAADLSISGSALSPEKITFTGVVRNASVSIGDYGCLELDGNPGVLIASSVYIDGVNSKLLKTDTGGSGGAAPTSPGNGGTGGGGLIIITKDLTVTDGEIDADGGNGEEGDVTSLVEASGGAGEDGFMIRIGDDTAGNGGDGGAYSGGPAIAGAGGTITYTTTDAPTLRLDLLKAMFDWWLVNVIGKNPSTNTSFPNVYGAGGGGGGEDDGYQDCGGGGGSGGEIIILVNNIDVGRDGIINAAGGCGGLGGSEGGYDTGGDGGGGGLIYILYETSYSIEGNIDIGGGSGGDGDYVGDSGADGNCSIIQV